MIYFSFISLALTVRLEKTENTFNKITLEVTYNHKFQHLEKQQLFFTMIEEKGQALPAQ